jgi:hypothetical protein
MTKNDVADPHELLIKQLTKELVRELLKESDINSKPPESKEKLSPPGKMTKYFKSLQMSNLAWSIIIGSICLICIAFAWTNRIKTVNISFEAVSSNVTIHLTENWTLTSSFYVKELYINNLNTVIATDIDINFSRFIDGNLDIDIEPAVLTMEGKNICIKELILPKGAKIDMSLTNDIFAIYTKGEPVYCRIDTKDAELVLIEGDEEKSKRINAFEYIRIKSSKAFSFPTELKFTLEEDNFKLRNLKTSSIKFLEEYPPGTGIFESTIKSALIRIIETDDKEILREGDILTIDNIMTRRLDFRMIKNIGIKAFFEGSVSNVLAGTKKYERDLAPNFIEFIYNQNQLGFFWSAVVFLWGILWSLKNSIFGNKF